MTVRFPLLVLVLLSLVAPSAAASTTFEYRFVAGLPVGVGCGVSIPCVSGYDGIASKSTRFEGFDGRPFVLRAEGAAGTPGQAGICFYPTSTSTGESLGCANTLDPHFESGYGHVPAGTLGITIFARYGADLVVTLEVA